ncbi:hypothetical protein NC651_039279 [Populus alba x Populus x berolinensis]|nr:hypothetical protein NC651_039279 [Populus alba x Populus x berolinensis]
MKSQKKHCCYLSAGVRALTLRH